MMDKRKALITLIKASNLLLEEDRVKLLAALPNLSEDEVYNIGRFLALEKKKSLENNTKLISKLDKLLALVEDKINH